MKQILSKPFSEELLLLFTATTIKAIKNATATTPTIILTIVNRFSTDDRRLQQLDFLYNRKIVSRRFKYEHRNSYSMFNSLCRHFDGLSLTSTYQLKVKRTELVVDGIIGVRRLRLDTKDMNELFDTSKNIIKIGVLSFVDLDFVAINKKCFQDLKMVNQMC